jgi:hypothetical protein
MNIDGVVCSWYSNSIYRNGELPSADWHVNESRTTAEHRRESSRMTALDAFDRPSGGGRFYEKCGFTEVGRAVDRGVPLIYFEFVLRRSTVACL